MAEALELSERTLKTRRERLDTSKPKFYALDMFPYPSGVGLHVGHPEGYTATDIVRGIKHDGHTAFFPWDGASFGLPAEQYAIDGNAPERDDEDERRTISRAVAKFGFFVRLGQRVVRSTRRSYKWTQGFFCVCWRRI